MWGLVHGGCEVVELNYWYREFALRTLRFCRETYARLTGRSFHCRSLSGEEVRGCYVNSDMTVSCNCQDVDGIGQLGDLRKQTFEEVFAGEKANRLRQELAQGRLPMNRCAVCFFLSHVRRGKATREPLAFHLPKGFCIENTVLCNLRCLSCCRERVMSIRSHGRSLTLNDVEVLSQTLRRLGATFCGFHNLGEPFFSPNVRQELETLRKHNPEMKIFISTNGTLIDNEDKRAAALLADHILFSIDGISTEMVQRYQRGGNFEKAYENMKAVVQLRNSLGRKEPAVVWKYVVFRWNDHPSAIRTLLQMAEAAGVDCVQLTFARNPWHGVSWRFLCSPFYRSLAKLECGRFRHIWFSKSSEQMEEGNQKAA
jgi:MoaA/NifB/PqqE/SkfB family radical SAM enzyme